VEPREPKELKGYCPSDVCASEPCAPEPRLQDLLCMQSDELSLIEDYIYCLNEKLRGESPKAQTCEAVNLAGGLLGLADRNFSRVQNCRVKLAELVSLI